MNGEFDYFSICQCRREFRNHFFYVDRVTSRFRPSSSSANRTVRTPAARKILTHSTFTRTLPDPSTRSAERRPIGALGLPAPRVFPDVRTSALARLFRPDLYFPHSVASSRPDCFAPNCCAFERFVRVMTVRVFVMSFTPEFRVLCFEMFLLNVTMFSFPCFRFAYQEEPERTD